MSTPDEYRQYADECMRMADNARNDADKAAWLKIAQRWLRLIPHEPSVRAATPIALPPDVAGDGGSHN